MKNIEFEKIRLLFEKAGSSDEVRSLYIKTLNKFRKRYKNTVYDYANQNLLDVIDRRDFFLEMILNKKVLDLGCGDGYFANKLAKNNIEVVGLDMIPKRIRLARENIESSNIKFICSTIEKAELPADYFDVVIISHVLEHVFQPNPILEIAKKALKDNGAIFVILPHKIGVDPTHIRFISSDKIKKKLEKIGAVSKKYIVGTKGFGYICKVKK